jgi:uncharacterized delta-60 repeat protein
VCVVVATLGLLGFGGEARAGPGAIDQRFGRGGLALVHISDDPGVLGFAGIVRLRDGSLVVAGSTFDFVVARWSPTGRLRSRRVYARTPVGSLVPNAMIAARDGTLFAAGSALPPSNQDGRKTAVGSIDGRGFPNAAFGSGGLAFFTFPGAGADARTMLGAPGRRILVGGYALVDGQVRWALAELTAGGQVDPTFGSGGIVTTELPGVQERGGSEAPIRTSIDALAIQPDRKIVAAGSGVDARTRRTRAIVARYLPDGSLDTSFGGGVVKLSFARGRPSRAAALALQPLRRRGADRTAIVIAGSAGDPNSLRGRFALARLRTDGTLDPSFGHRGLIVTDVRHTPGATSLLAVRDGGLVAAGMIGDDHPGFAVARYRANGRPDTRFGSSGRICITVPGRFGLPAGQFPERDTTGLLAQPDGRLVAAGQIEDRGADINWLLARVNPRFSGPTHCPT